MTKHTPGKLEYNDPAKYTQGHGKFSEIAVYAPGAAFPWRMAEVSGPDAKTAIANAARIVHTWNCHDELVEALELISNIEPDPENMGRFHDIAIAALKSAKANGED